MEATRADIADMRQELRAIRAEQSTLRTELHGEISAGRREMATMFRWLVGLMFTFFLASMGAFAAVYTQIETIIARIPK